MKLRDLSGKKLINIKTGRVLGTVRDTDLVFETNTGSIESIIFQQKGLKGEKYIVIPVGAIKQVGTRVILVDLNE
ncbi:YlmC/YmxH family sporulation protein [Halothermothrix orenii]|uniref:Sporulation protein YlmC/YmxH n=1 Tax=Halothermothrix orenii (strain H 168 / OCM 544 / DSM 9562) TaxID=373903 RepID=B8CW86_HALOH|nr:YlmC/YmxH family sporulation protein [Halothermothrix orenii]ACL69555.1 Sporulation protein YlmC/YmxH [Halothermothrix orenii H 168]